MSDNLKDKYYKFFGEELKKIQEQKERMLKNGWKDVCIEPNIISFEKWKETQNG